MNPLHDKVLGESPLLWIDLFLCGRGRFWRNVGRRILWSMLQQEQPGLRKRVGLPPGFSREELVDVLDELSRADAIIENAKGHLSELMGRLPEDHRSSAALGLAERFIEQASTDQVRVEMFSLLLERARLDPADRDLLERARASIETRMMEYVLPVLDAREVMQWDLQERAHLAQFGTNPARAGVIDQELEHSATHRGRVLMRALSVGTSLSDAEEQEGARWK